MDGFKIRLNQSVQLKLSFSLSLIILLIALVAGIFSFVSAFDEAHELQDNMLRQVAALFDRTHLPLTRLANTGRSTDSDEESLVIVQYLAEGSNTSRTWGAGSPLPLPITLADGMHTIEVNGEPFRVFFKTMIGGERIAVAQETGARDEIARNSALRTLMPFLILVPIMLLMVADLVRKMFQPIFSLSAEIDQRAEQDLHPVEEIHVPIEIRPFVVAINRLLIRIAQSMETQRRFVADAAHELRSPLTALSLQAERLAEVDIPSAARERLVTLRSGIERSRNLLNQLLSLATAQAALDRPKSSVSVQHVYRCVLEDLISLAEAKQIDIGAVEEQDVRVLTNESDFMTLIKNLVDNAIRYTPNSGKVDLSVTVKGNRAILRIQDSGPGIQVFERERVFDPFYRTLGSDQIGSGLGLSIVKAISERIDAEIQLGFSDEMEQSGLCVYVLVPLMEPDPKS
jgi:two-component system, OmpR family, sensor kinase